MGEAEEGEKGEGGKENGEEDTAEFQLGGTAGGVGAILVEDVFRPGIGLGGFGNRGRWRALGRNLSLSRGRRLSGLRLARGKLGIDPLQMLLKEPPLAKEFFPGNFHNRLKSVWK